MALDGENGPLVIDESAEFEKSPVEVQDFRKCVHHFRGIWRLHLTFLKKTRKMSTRNQLDVETLGSRPIMHTNPPQTLACGGLRIIATNHYIR